MEYNQFIKNNKDRISEKVGKIKEMASTIPNKLDRDKFFQKEMRNFKNQLIKEYSDGKYAVDNLS